MTPYVILLLVLAGLILVAAAFFDRWRGRQIARDLRDGIPASSEHGAPRAPSRQQEQIGRHRAG